MYRRHKSLASISPVLISPVPPPHWLAQGAVWGPCWRFCAGPLNLLMWGQPFLARALHAEVAASVRLADAPQELVHTLEQAPSVPGTAPTTLHTCVWVCSQERHSPECGGALEKASEGEGCTVVGLEQSRGSSFFFLMFIIYFWLCWVLGAVGAFL